MKPILICAALLAPLAAHAQAFPFTPAQQKSCLLEAQVFQYAASYRDSGMSPQQAFGNISAMQGVPKQSAKGIINTVYFDSNFTGTGGQALFNQIYEACLYPKGRYQPLQ